MTLLELKRSIAENEFAVQSAQQCAAAISDLEIRCYLAHTLCVGAGEANLSAVEVRRQDAVPLFRKNLNLLNQQCRKLARQIHIAHDEVTPRSDSTTAARAAKQA